MSNTAETAYLPYGEPSQITVSYLIEQDAAEGLTTLDISVTSSKVGDKFRFVVDDAGFNVASPMEDLGVPVSPVVNEEGQKRVDRIRVRHSSSDAIVETVQGILSDLDEYVRAKKLFADDNMTETDYIDFITNG